MQLIRYVSDGAVRVGASDGGSLVRLPNPSLAELLRLPLGTFRACVEAGGTPEVGTIRPLPPIDGLTEVWAAGVSYRRSMRARQHESASADVYARVYDALRPELFYKSPAWRVSGHGEPIGIRRDSAINVAEPELALVINSHGEIAGVTVCNDVSSRSIEGENPLYLPQAKVYAGSCALGPAIRPIWEIPDLTSLGIDVIITRAGTVIFSGSTSTTAMRRSFNELVSCLGSNLHFPDGAVLSTGTGIVPDLTFSLAAGDTVSITIEKVGTLTNTVRSASCESFSWLTPDPDRSPRSQFAHGAAG